MADWKVSRQEIKLYVHPDADKLELGNLGGYQVVVRKGEFKDGDTVIFIPEKSLLPEAPWAEPFKLYLVGPDKNRVKSIKLRNELSMGLILPDEDRFAQYGIGDDISEQLGVEKYEPPIPTQLAGEVEGITNLSAAGHEFSKHDVEQFAIHRDEFQVGEEVIVTEKIHGSQTVIIRTAEGERAITSKGLFDRGLLLKSSETNSYWRGAADIGLFETIDQHYPEGHVQVFAEMVPCQGGFNYGQNGPTLFIYDVRLGHEGVAYDDLPQYFQDHWVPVIYRGPYDEEQIRGLRKGMESVSGKEKHIREGVVVRPINDRRSSENFRLFLKLINPKYKDTGEEFN